MFSDVQVLGSFDGLVEAVQRTGAVGENQIPVVDENQRKLKNFGGLVLGCIDAEF